MSEEVIIAAILHMGSAEAPGRPGRERHGRDGGICLELWLAVIVESQQDLKWSVSY
jgi:hypothetical protein